MKKTLLLALALTSVSLAGCTEETPDANDATVINADPTMAPIVADPAVGTDPMMADTMGAMGTGTMEAAPMEAAPMTADTVAVGTGM